MEIASVQINKLFPFHSKATGESAGCVSDTRSESSERHLLDIAAAKMTDEKSFEFCILILFCLESKLFPGCGGMRMSPETSNWCLQSTPTLEVLSSICPWMLFLFYLLCICPTLLYSVR